tara:strand:- start:194 stop:754 length:561 start_codon:yes stop_codon:yes gene_type:complete
MDKENRLSLLKDILSLSNEANKKAKEKNKKNFMVLTSYMFDNKDVVFNGQTINTTVKNSIVSEFITAGFKVDKEGELSKMSQTKINLFSRIYSHKKVQALIKDCVSNQSVIDVLISKKLASQGKLRKFIDGSKKGKTSLELFYNAYKELDEDEKQEGIIWINATAKVSGFQTTQKELDELDNKASN